jgi:hypothetical protein
MKQDYVFTDYPPTEAFCNLLAAVTIETSQPRQARAVQIPQARERQNHLQMLTFA